MARNQDLLKHKSSRIVPLGTDQQMPGEEAWGVLSRLMGRLELDELMGEFHEIARQNFDCAGLMYTAPDEDGSYVIGKQCDHHARYNLSADGESLGVLVLSAETPLGAAELARAEQCIALLITPLRNALRYEAALRQARTDPLTGLLNRSTLDETLQREVGLARRHGEPFSILVADLDNFKTINDGLGHQAGDLVLREFAEVLRRCARESDLVFRTGGDEFLVALSHTGLSGANLLAERLRRSVDRYPFEFDGETVPMQVSVGVSTLESGDDFLSLLQRGDDALYGAKEQGRNKINHVASR